MKNTKSLLFACTTFLGAFLLFQVQPILGKYIQPWFGSTSSVWTTCMMFFQITLFVGYLYAHLLAAKCRLQQWGAAVHLLLVVLAVIIGVFHAFRWPAPILPPYSGSMAGGFSIMGGGPSTPSAQIFIILLSSIGLPFLLLSANSSLMQAWKHQCEAEEKVYSLYAISNAGSLLALLSYPLVVENYIPLSLQATIWSGLFVVYACLLGACVWVVATSARSGSHNTPLVLEDARCSYRTEAQFLGLGLSMVGSMMLLAITNQLTQDISPIPFLWVLPLSLYLLTFIITYAHKTEWIQKWLAPLGLLGVSMVLFVLFKKKELSIVSQVALLSGGLLGVCLFCHGMAYSMRPPAKQLTRFYVLISLGGALGGVFVNIIAPLVFPSYWEVQLCLLLVIVAGAYFIFKHREHVMFKFRFAVLFIGVVLTIGLVRTIYVERESKIFMSRNFYGRLAVEQEVRGSGMREIRRNALIHGDIVHGIQFSRTKYRYLPTAYFTKESGVGRAILYHPKRLRGEPMYIGIIGQGIGVLASYGQTNDVLRFYELNSAVNELANDDRYFTYMKDCQAELEVVVGDGRLSLQEELQVYGARQFDVLVLDVFNGDAVPAHLLTKEAFDIMLQHLHPEGALAIHMTNKHLNLLPVGCAMADEFGLVFQTIRTPGDGRFSMPALWMLMSRNPDAFNNEVYHSGAIPSASIPKGPLWTDDYTPIWRLLHL